MGSTRKVRGLLDKPEARFVGAAATLLFVSWPVCADLGWSPARISLAVFAAWAAAIVVLAADAWPRRARTGSPRDGDAGSPHP
jgi:hypothetical protein